MRSENPHNATHHERGSPKVCVCRALVKNCV